MPDKKPTFALISISNVNIDLKSASKAAIKLIDTIAAGTGRWWEPHHKVRMAQAEANAAIIRVGADAKTKAIAARAAKRLLQQEIHKQKNLEAVIGAAVKALPEEAEDKPVDNDWVTRFFNLAGEISNEKMQGVWGKVLAGETAAPGQYSLRTLDVLKNLSQKEAEAFQRACHLAFSEKTISKGMEARILTSSPGRVFPEYGLSYDDVLFLKSAGLLHDSDQLSVVYDGPNKNIILNNNGIVIRASHPGETKFTFYQFLFTRAGTELLSLIEAHPNFEYLRMVPQFIHGNGYQFKRLVNSIVDGQMVITEVDI